MNTRTAVKTVVKTLPHDSGATTNYLWLVGLLFVAVVLAIPTAHAQNRPNYGGQAYDRNSVVMYTECGFRGQSQQVGIGEHSKIENLRFPNDQMSSISIPAGQEVILYEDSKFRGGYATLTQNVDCFDSYWNNKVSSIKVVQTRGGFDPNYPAPGIPNPAININNLGYVTFANSELRKINNNTWALGTRGQYNSLTNFNIVNRDATSLFMQSTVSAERIRIDLASNTVTYFTVNGLTQSYPIQEKQPGIVNIPGNPVVPTPVPNPNIGSEPNRRISGRCFDYRAYTLGGDASLRFEGKDNLERFSTRAVTGRVCHSGKLTMGIGKTAPNTNVIVEIQGKQFRFASNEKEDLYMNNWYRKNIRLVVGN
jgi:hypothetical protein